jgi:hypothetical protein
MQVPLTGAIFGGPVTCLAVNGTRAILNFQDNGGIVTLEVADSPTEDTIKLLPSARQPGDCSPLSPSSLVAEVFAGDLVVVDAPPLPTSKDECKSGGWRNYPGFKNQGDCVAFVATRGKDPPV